MDWTTTRPSLLERLRDPADAAAWRDFDHRYGDLILRYARSRGLQLADAEDVRQAVLLNLSRSMPRFEYSPARGRFRSYLGRVVSNAIARWSARRPGPECPGTGSGALSLLDEIDRAGPPSGSGAEDRNPLDEQWDREWVRHHCRLALAVLRRTHDQRSLEAFELLLAGTHPAEVARQMGMSLDGVEKIKQRIRARLRQVIAEQILEEERAWPKPTTPSTPAPQQ